MGWSVGYDIHWKRDIGYGVPAYCDHPGCGEKIDRGLGYVCGGAAFGGDHGCGLFFCPVHAFGGKQLCARCAEDGLNAPFPATPDHPEWIKHKLTDESWGLWRDEHPEEVAKMRTQVNLGSAVIEETAPISQKEWDALNKYRKPSGAVMTALTALTDAEKQRALRGRMRDKGYVLRQFWVHPKDWPLVKRYLERINKRRER